MTHPPGRPLLAGLTGLAVGWVPLHAQTEHPVRGSVRDAATAQPLGDAVVACLGAERSTHAITTVSHGRFRDAPAGLDLISPAPTATSTGGLIVRALGPLEGGVRYRYVGSRAADSGSSIVAKGYILGEVFATWHAGRVDLVLTMDNLLDATWNEAQCATTSRLRGEPSRIPELNFTPGAPRSVQLGVRYCY
jgi:hypothetical protein